MTMIMFHLSLDSLEYLYIYTIPSVLRTNLQFVGDVLAVITHKRNALSFSLLMFFL